MSFIRSSEKLYHLWDLIKKKKKGYLLSFSIYEKMSLTFEREKWEMNHPLVKGKF